MKKLTAVLLLSCSSILGADYVVFDASPTPNVVYKFRIRTDTNSPTYPWTFNLGTNQFIYLTNGPWGIQSYSVVAVSTNGIESFSSNEVLSTNRPGAPLQLRVIKETEIVTIHGSSADGLAFNKLADITNGNAIVLRSEQRSSKDYFTSSISSINDNLSNS
jgi:hypothetical protein